ncbi:MAG: VWA domain-containing protein [Pseudomonadota bacterium]|nr:VWA domain-containing protein [Pseudomonadota bacterium]
MFINFFFGLRDLKVPVTIREYLMLLEAMEKGVGCFNVDDFYFLARSALVKDERFFDRFDQAFGVFFNGLEKKSAKFFEGGVPENWLRSASRRLFSDEELAKLERLDFDQLIEEFQKRLSEQDKAHSGGSKWVGTGGTSPFGNSGVNPAGIRIGGEGGGGSATKVWKKREYRNLNDDVEIGTRNIKIALRRLRKFLREGAKDEFFLEETINATAKNAGYLEIHMRAERKNRVKVLLFIDVGGTMDSHVKVSEELFSAAKTEFKHLEYFYFHNFIYERVWQENRRGYGEYIPTWEVLNTYGPDYKVIFVGDATMSPYEVTEVGGSVEHWNEEAGAVWFQRFLEKFSDIIWLNPESSERWPQTMSTQLIYRLINGRMFPMTLNGLDQAMGLLSKRQNAVLKPINLQ